MESPNGAVLRTLLDQYMEFEAVGIHALPLGSSRGLQIRKSPPLSSLLPLHFDCVLSVRKVHLLPKDAAVPGQPRNESFRSMCQVEGCEGTHT